MAWDSAQEFLNAKQHIRRQGAKAIAFSSFALGTGLSLVVASLVLVDKRESIMDASGIDHLVIVVLGFVFLLSLIFLGLGMACVYVGFRRLSRALPLAAFS